MSWLDALLAGIVSTQVGGTPLPQERVLNFTNATGADDPLNGRTNITLAAGSGIGGGAPQSTQVGTIVIAQSVTQCIECEIGSVSAVVDFSTITPSAGLAFQFDLTGASQTNTLTLKGATFVSASQGSVPLGQIVFVGSGQSIVVKYSSLTGQWITP